MKQVKKMKRVIHNLEKLDVNSQLCQKLAHDCRGGMLRPTILGLFILPPSNNEATEQNRKACCHLFFFKLGPILC